ncbi:MAG: DUF5915 domain-containing protein, partial [Chitinispirillaceae bacterium]|nr:DUF5915 domain-containing protein [Chitinispirillaceae bacterium]
ISVIGQPITIEDIEIRRNKKSGIEVETSANMTIALDTTITEELKAEGISREFVNRIQNLRKSKELYVTDRIEIKYSSSEVLEKAVSKFKDYIAAETLAVRIEYLKSPQNGMEEVEVEGEKVFVDLRVV